MICIGYTCDKCKHEHEQLFDGWKPACDAFPEGIPSDLYFGKEPNGVKECNNGIGYVPKEENADEQLQNHLPDPEIPGSRS